MPSIKDLKKRIGTVKNTQQTTKAMKMVSAAKLRRAQEAIQSQRPYARKIDALIKRLISLPDLGFESPLIRKDEVVASGSADDGARRKNVLLVLVTSDRGLCGGFNSNVIRTAQRWLKANVDHYGTIQLGFVGRRGYDFFKTKKVTLGPYKPELGGKVSFLKAKGLAELLMASFTSGEVDEIKIIYNEFKNAVSQEVITEDFLPLSPKSFQPDPAQRDDDVIYLVKPSPKAVLEQLLNKYFTIQAFRIMLESQASEHGARMSAMENATNNASDMISHLTLLYNKQRQAGITKELLEIISGTESQKNAG